MHDDPQAHSSSGRAKDAPRAPLEGPASGPRELATAPEDGARGSLRAGGNGRGAAASEGSLAVPYKAGHSLPAGSGG